MMSGSSSWRGGGGGAGASGDSFSRKPSRVNFASQGVAALTPVKASIQADSSSPTKPVAGRPSPNMRTQATSDAAAAHSPLRPSRTLGNAAAAATTPLRDSVDALPHHGVSPSPLRALSLDLSQHHSRSVSSTLSASMSFDSMSSARSWQSLPSLSLSLQSKSTALSDLEFASTTPVFSRNRFDLFGMEGVHFTRKDFRTVDEEPPRVLSPPRSSQRRIAFRAQHSVSSTRDLNPKMPEPDPVARKERRKSATGYMIKNNFVDPFMKSDSERKEKLQHEQGKKRSTSNEFFIKKKAKSPPRSPPKTPKTPNGRAGSHRRALSFAADEMFEGFAVAVLQGGENSALSANPSLSLDSLSLSSIERVNDELSNGVYEKYFGDSAILDMQQKFRRAAADLEHYPEDEDLPEELRTPRSRFYREVVRQKVLPLNLLLRKDTHPLGLHLGHKGLGDERIAPALHVVERLPAMQTLDLSDNRLTDKSLLPLAQKLQHLKHLTHLDLSFNKIDESSAAIMDYLRDPHCQLRTLLLNGADVDDRECANIAAAISENKSIRTLGLAKNLIGKDELLNVVYPDLVTGGEALGDMLRVNTTLVKLDLSWNAIRLDSAIALAKSLETNSTLKTLLLGYNAFGDMPSQVLGRALKCNKGLTELDLECNSINPKAATVLANAISFNDTLLKLNINGNTLGKIGAQALVAAIQRSSTEHRRLQVSFINCDCTKDNENVFSAANPHGTWRLNLREPYGQMVATECLYLANYKAGCRIVKLIYTGNQVTLDRSYVAKDDEGEAGQMKKFKLEEFYKNSRLAANELLAGNFIEASVYLLNLLTQFGFKMDEETRMNVLRKTKDIWTAKAKREGRDDLQETFLYEIFFALFVINDTDLSGTMEMDEFLETLASLGKTEYDHDAAKRLMSEYDRDESGSIDANEFGNIMLNEFCNTEIPRGELVDVSTGRPWEIPVSGHCIIQLSYQCDVPTLFDIGADHGIDNIIQSIRNAKTDDQREILFQNTTSSPYFFLSFEQAQLLFEEMQGLNRLPLDLMASILPQIATEDQAIKFLDTNLNDLGKLALRIKIGSLYCSYVGLHTAHYAIDMSIPTQRNGGRRLGAICVTEGKKCRQAGVNSSQKGNQSNFRNEKLGIAPVEITGRWFSTTSPSVTNNKVLHCDYVSTTKPRKSTLPMTESRFERIVQQLGLEEVRSVWSRIQTKEAEYLAQQARELAWSMGLQDAEGSERSDSPRSLGSLGTEMVSHSSRPSMRGGLLTASFAAGAGGGGGGGGGGAQTRRSSAVQSSESLLSSSFLGGSAPRPNSGLTQLSTATGYPLSYDDFPELACTAPLTFTAMREAYMEYIDTCHHYWDIYPEERMRDVSRVNYNPNERPPTPEELRSGPVPSRSCISPIFPLAYRKILELQIMMPTCYLSVAQVAQLMRYFPPDEAYLRILLLQSVLSHIVDLENAYILIDEVMTLGERYEAFHRIGIMNLLDPMKPDRLYHLDLRRYDHREWVKILVALAIAEPGDNWERVEYRWGKYDDPVPGWTLPATWCHDDDGGNNGGPRTFGWLSLIYRSHGNGCMPVISVRKYLRKRTLAGMKRII